MSVSLRLEPAAHYVPLCNMEDFSQCLPKDPDLLEDITDDELRKRGALRYRDSNTGKTFTVPHIWYNTGLLSQASHVEFMAEQSDRSAAAYEVQIERASPEWARSLKWLAQRARDSAKRCRKRAAEMRAAFAFKGRS